MNEGQSAVTYEGLPISSGGAHKLGRTSTRKAVESWRDFLAACTRPVSLSFPEAIDDDVAVLVPWLQSALSMKLSPKHWALWTRTKSGTSYRGRKLSVTPRR